MLRTRAGVIVCWVRFDRTCQLHKLSDSRKTERRYPLEEKLSAEESHKVS
jgi:hypothetical protein